MLILLAASQLASPAPIQFDKWFSDDDYPSELLNSNETAFLTVTQTLVDSTGRIVGCRIETPSANPKVDAIACAAILKRGRFVPARWSDGSPVAGVYRKLVRFMIPGDRLADFSDVEVEVASLPAGTKSPALVQVAFASDANGKITDCGVAPPDWGKAKPPQPSLVSVACKVVRAEWKPFTVLDPNGKPSRSVQNASVKFSLPKRR
jgi:hypothetical protein